MAGDAFRILVLPRGEQADITQFGAELQKICDKVSGVKVKLQADPNEITNSIKNAVSTVKFDVQFNASSIEASVKAALTGKTFDINVNPIVQNGGGSGGNSGGNDGAGSNGSGGQQRQRQQPIGQRDTFARLVNSEVYLQGLVKKFNAARYDDPNRELYRAQYQEYARNLVARKQQFVAANNVSMGDLNTALYQTEQFTRAQLAAQAAADKTAAAWNREVNAVAPLEEQLETASARLADLDARKNQLSQRGLMQNLGWTTDRTTGQNVETGLLEQYRKQLDDVKSAFQAVQAPNFRSESIKDQTTKMADLRDKWEAFRQTESRVVQELDDFQKKSGNYKMGFFDEFVEGISKKFGWAVMAAAAREAKQALQQLYTNVVQLDGALTQISIVTGTSGSALRSFANDASETAKAVGSTTSAIISSTETYARLGYSLTDSLNLADITARYANVAGVDTESATAALTSVMKGFNIDPSNMELVVDKLVKVGQEYAISAGELGDALQRGGAALAAGGATFDEAISILAAGNAAVQNADTVGNAMKTVSARIRSAKSELIEMGEEVDDLVLSSSKYRGEIKALSGVEIMKDANTYKSVYEILVEIAKVYDSLSDINKAQLLEDLGGKRNAQVIASIITNLQDLQGSYEATQNAAGTLATANSIYLDSIQGKMNQLSTSYEQLSMKLVSSTAIKVIVDALKKLIEILNAIDSSTGGLSTTTVEITALIVLMPALMKAFAGTSAIKTFGTAIKGVSESIVSLAATIPAVGSKIAGFIGGSVLGPIGAVAAVVAAAILAFKGLRAVLPTLSDKKQQLEETKTDISQIESKLSEVKSRLEELNAIENPSLADQDEIDKLEKENEQLEWKLELKKKLADMEAVGVENAAIDKYNYEFTETRQYGRSTRKNGVDGFYNELDSVETYTKKAEEAWSRYNDAILSGNSKTAEKANSDAERWEEKRREAIQNMGSEYQRMKNIADENGITGATQKGRDILDTLAQMELELAKLEGVSLSAGTAMSSMLDQYKYAPLKEALDKMKETGTLSAEAIQQMYEEGQKIAETGEDLENPNYLLMLLIETLSELLGIDLSSGTQAFGIFADALNGVGDAAKNASDGLQSIDYETVDAAKSKVDAVTAAMKDYKEYNGLTKSSVDKLTAAFPALRDALYDSEGKLTAQGRAALKSKDAMLALTKTTLASEKAINGMNLAEAKEELKKLRAEIYKTQLAMESVGGAGSTPITKRDSNRPRADGNKIRYLQEKAGILEAQITSRESAIDEIMKSLNSNFTKSSSSGSSADKFKQALEKQLKILKHQLEMERITYEEYYAGVAKIRDAYQAKNPTKYQEEIWDLEKEIFKGRLTTFEDFVNDYNTIAENQMADGKIVAARTAYDQILDETKKMIDWGVSYGLSENGEFMQKVRKQWRDTCKAIMDQIKSVYDDYESYADTFDLWGSGTGKVGFTKTDFYEKWLKDTKEAYDKGLLLYKDYVAQYNQIAGKLFNIRRDSIDTIINMTIDMIKQEKEDQIDAIEEQVDAYQELIDKKKELLEQSNDELDHEEKVAELVSEIAELQSKIAQLSLDDSREAAAKRQELEKQLRDKQKELDREQRDWGLDQTKGALDDTKDEFEKEKEEEKKIIEKSINDWMSLYRQAIKMLESDWNGMYSKLMEYNEKYCNSIDGVDSLRTAWENVDAVVKQYGYDVEAVRNSGGNLGIAPPNPMNGNLVTNGVDEAGVKAVVAQMRANSVAWHSADASEKKRLEQENLRLGNSLGQYGLKVVRDEPTGVWYIDHKGGTRLFDRYHTGGVVGNKPTNNDREVLALLEKGELVLDDKKKRALSAMFDRLAAVASSAAATKMSYRIDGPTTQAGDVFAPSVSVVINHDGEMDDNDARRYGQLTADAVLEKLRTAFNRRGL